MSNPSRRTFLSRTGLTALVAAPVATALLNSPTPVAACTPVPELPRDIYAQLVKSFRPIEDRTKGWVGKLGGQTNQFLGLQFLRAFYDEYCGTYPRWPIPPRRFEPYVQKLPDFDKIAELNAKWAADVDLNLVPGLLAITIVRDDLNASFGQVQQLAAPKELERELLWRRWWPWPC